MFATVEYDSSGVDDDREPGRAEGDLDGEAGDLALRLANLDVLAAVSVDFVVGTQRGAQRVGDLLRDVVLAHSARDRNRRLASRPTLRLNGDAQKPVFVCPAVDRKFRFLVESSRQRAALRQGSSGTEQSCDGHEPEQRRSGTHPKSPVVN